MNASLRNANQGWPHDPSFELETTYRLIHATRMQDVPILNPAIRIEAVGFHAWQGGWLGVMVTPWFINLMLLPGEAPLPAVASGEETLLALPEGQMPFIGGHEAAIGPYLMCSLFSPLPQFADHDSAVATAREVLQLLCTPPAPPPPNGPDLSRRRLFGLRA